MKKIFLLGLMVLSFSFPAFASSDIVLDNVTAGPDETKDLSLDKLAKDVEYVVSCIVTTNSGAAAYYPVKILFGDNRFDGPISLNNEPVTDDLLKLPGDRFASGSSLRMERVNSSVRDKISFKNLDHDVTVNFYGCIAQVQVG